MRLIALILIESVCVAGFAIMWWYVANGRSNLWMGNRRLEVDRANSPVLFWISFVGSTAFLTGLATAGVAIFLFGQ
jgi:hypothetical protein